MSTNANNNQTIEIYYKYEQAPMKFLYIINNVLWKGTSQRILDWRGPGVFGEFIVDLEDLEEGFTAGITKDLTITISYLHPKLLQHTDVIITPPDGVSVLPKLYKKIDNQLTEVKK